MNADFTKIYRFAPEFEYTGESRVQWIDRRDTRLVKHASSDALDYIRTVDPMPGQSIVLVLAMSGSEFYGNNRNGDAFAERPVYQNGQMVLGPHETLPAHHKSFVSHGNNYLHHVNKDPKKAVGTIMESFYNDIMHRVELLLGVDNNKASQVVQRIQDGEYPGVSMGCRIKYDICSICGNRAPTRNEYCEHVNGRDPRYGMNSLLPNGQRCFVWNPSPLLFDLSWVWKPADRIGYMLKKVAEESSPYEIMSADLGLIVKDAEIKRSALDKLSIIDKIVRGDVEAVQTDHGNDPSVPGFRQLHQKMKPSISSRFEPLPEPTLQACASKPFPAIFSSLASMGIHPTVIEIYRIICHKVGDAPDPQVMGALPAMQSAMLGAFGDCPGIFDEFLDQTVSRVGPEHVDPSIVHSAQPESEKRALYKDYLFRNYVPESMGMLAPAAGVDPENVYYRPAQETLNLVDPVTQQAAQTTRNVAEKTDWENKKRQGMEAGILAAGTGLGYKLLSMLGKRGGRYGNIAELAKYPLAAGGGYAAFHAGTKDVPTVRSAEGYDVPYNAPMVKGGSSRDIQQLKELANMVGPTALTAAPIVGGGLATAMMTSDHLPQALAQNQTVQTVRQHPLAMASGTALGLGALATALKRRAFPIKVAYVVPRGDGVTMEPFSLGQFCRDLARVWMPCI